MHNYGYGHQSISPDDIAAVGEVLNSDFLTQGPKVQEFENALLRHTGAKYCVAVANATAGLHLAMLALGIGEGDEVITSPNTFLSSANCILYAGGRAVFADIDFATGNIDPEQIEKLISARTKAIIPVHFAGQSCDMETIAGIARRHGLRIVEDAAHAIGSDYQGDRVGCCRYSDLTVFSFHPVKTITTGEGGAVLTNDRQLYETLLMLRSHGVTRDPARMIRNEGPWYYEMRMLGFNYRITDLQSALGCSQLKRLEWFKRRRREIVAFYRERLGGIRDVVFLTERSFSNACFHLCPLLIDFSVKDFSRVELFEQLRKCGLQLQVHYIPVHLQPYYRERFGTGPGDCPVAEMFYEREVSLPLYPDLTDEDVMFISDTVEKCIGSV